MSTNTSNKRVGRPRSAEVIARDERIYKLLGAGPRSRSSLAKETGHDRATVSLSLQRLQRDDRIRKCLDNGSIVWSINDGTPCP